ncbi:MAG: hypothetical protein EOO22_18620 [Comamonadaceae bacterium]|nr:MAG: hypothetical protein EOO22_18620 [Comamonadaceae bacterium]
MRELGPLAIVVGGGALAATATVQPLTPLAFAGYALMTGAAAVRVGRREGVVTIPVAWAAYPVMHLAHGVGFGAGLVRSAIRRTGVRRHTRRVRRTRRAPDRAPEISSEMPSVSRTRP